MPTLTTTFFGPIGGTLVMIGIIITMFIIMMITAFLFGPTLAPKSERVGMIMELPPYHKPRWKSLIRITLLRAGDIFLRALRVITLVSIIFFILSYTPDASESSSILYKIGIVIEPITKFFGLSWQTFMAFVASIVSKEALLGVLNTLYTSGSDILTSTIGVQNNEASSITNLLTTYISKPEALALIFATTFNVPCVMALAATSRETHSIKWTIKIALYYTGMALLMSCIVYHIASIFMYYFLIFI